MAPGVEGKKVPDPDLSMCSILVGERVKPSTK